MSFEQKILEDLMRCHLGALIQLSGDKIPKGLSAHPNWHDISTPEVQRFIDKYRSFLRSLESVV